MMTAAAGLLAALLALLVLDGGYRLLILPSADRSPLTESDIGLLARLTSRNTAMFEGGNMGLVRRTSADTFELNLRSDNDDALPKFWRNWFYGRIDGVPTDRPVTMTLKGAGQWNYYLPFYSYDQKIWYQMTEKEVSQPTRLTVTMRRKFTRSTVYVARYVPYTVTDLTAFLKRIAKRRDVTVGTIGRTPEGREIPSISITTDTGSRQRKSRVLIHARTHPGEVASSFVLEGLVDYLTSNAPEARRLRDRLVFDIVPMLNVDGVAKGNNRVTPRGVNLEGKWYSVEGAPLELAKDRVPPEVRLLHSRVKMLLTDGIPVTVALNMHASGGTPEDSAFFFPHFGPRSRGYTAAESALFERQQTFIKHLANVQGALWFNRPTVDGGRSFAAKALPEAWWWSNFRDRVMALTMESAYGKAGPFERWIKPDDMRRIGRSMALALGRYHGLWRPGTELPTGASVARTIGQGPQSPTDPRPAH